MKNCYFLLLGLAFLILLSACNKSGVSHSTQISGKWHVVTDSTYNTFTVNTTQNGYAGVSGDYYDFRDDGKLYINEGSTHDTLAYTLVNSSAIQIQSFGWIVNGVQDQSSLIYSPDNSGLKITSNREITPAGFGWRSVSLKR